eukprot:GHVL01023922.1.p1 GENE.GHVL01023922.1~~GHVL01023922.1.p1  ORF type:complete len:484 (+),score=65.33 GHVL01023922.1:85-1536(+)
MWSEDLSNLLRMQLRDLLSKYGIKQRQVAALLGVQDGIFSMWVHKRFSPTNPFYLDLEQKVQAFVESCTADLNMNTAESLLANGLIDEASESQTSTCASSSSAIVPFSRRKRRLSAKAEQGSAAVEDDEKSDRSCSDHQTTALLLRDELRELLSKYGIKQRQVASLLGVQDPIFSMWVHQRFAPSNRFYSKLEEKVREFISNCNSNMGCEGLEIMLPSALRSQTDGTVTISSNTPMLTPITAGDEAKIPIEAASPSDSVVAESCQSEVDQHDINHDQNAATILSPPDEAMYSKDKTPTVAAINEDDVLTSEANQSQEHQSLKPILKDNTFEEIKPVSEIIADTSNSCNGGHSNEENHSIPVKNGKRCRSRGSGVAARQSMVLNKRRSCEAGRSSHNDNAVVEVTAVNRLESIIEQFTIKQEVMMENFLKKLHQVQRQWKCSNCEPNNMVPSPSTIIVKQEPDLVVPQKISVGVQNCVCTSTSN